MNELKSDVAELKRSVRDRKEGERDNQQAPSPTPEIEYGNRKPSSPPIIFDSSYELQEASPEMLQKDENKVPPILFDEEISLRPVVESTPKERGLIF